jgi:hypothetical protein
VDKASAFEDSIEDGSCQVFVVQHLSPLAQGFIGGEDHRPLSEMAIIDHVEQNVGSVGAIA